MTHDPIAGGSLLVLHGFNSAGTTEKAAVLRDAFPQLDVVSPSYSHDPAAAGSKIQRAARSALARDARLAVLGTSLGAFYARWIAATLGVPAILINPALDPASTLKRALGWNTNFKTGHRYRLEPVHLDRLQSFYLPESAPTGPTLVLLDMDDELLDSERTKAFFSNRAATRIVSYPNGEHRFAHLHEAIPEIRTHLWEEWNRCLVQGALARTTRLP